ncbi:(S)-8-oxocitronellyl enol synthase CYC1-like [Populus nigra]|uniref:(S)-8-oxocitronellyl enol synthase CYC1-like n=1 Tax=Populus nigra TaxID=3691 RepID=UPI002B273160|nr:(S)-8-oxocitronellyl enol synthase CYC1-like [Populus nigra]
MPTYCRTPASSRSVDNILLTLSVHATICQYEGLPFRYPGNKYTWKHFCDMSDARVLAEQQIWAAVFDVGFVAYEESDEKFDWLGMMKGKGKMWDEIVEKYELLETKMEDITCFEALNVVLNFRFQHVCSMIKSREFEFLGYADTLKSIQMWVGRLRAMKMIPRR